MRCHAGPCSTSEVECWRSPRTVMLPRDFSVAHPCNLTLQRQMPDQMTQDGTTGHWRALESTPWTVDHPRNFLRGGRGRVVPPSHAAQGLFSGPTGMVPVQPSERPDGCGRLWTAPNHYVQFLTTSHPHLQLFNPTPSNKRPRQTDYP